MSEENKYIYICPICNGKIYKKTITDNKCPIHPFKRMTTTSIDTDCWDGLDEKAKKHNN